MAAAFAWLMSFIQVQLTLIQLFRSISDNPMVVLLLITAVGKITIREAMETIWPFFGACVAVLMMVTFIPELSLWLPAQFK